MTRSRLAWLVPGALALALGACGEGDSATDHLDKALEYDRQGDLRASVIELKNALQRDPDLAQARWMLGQAYLKAGDPSAARKELERARDLGFREARLGKKLAEAMLFEGSFQEALDLVDGVDTADADPDWLALRGEALLALGRTDAARESFSAAIERQSDHPAARRGLARVNIVNGKLDEARGEVDRALQGGEPDLQTWLLKGELELALNRLDESEDAFRKAIEIDGKNVAARLALARALLAKRKPDDAAREIDRVAGKETGDPRVNYLRALVARQRNDLDAAKSSLREVLRVAPDHAPSLLLLGQIHYLQREFEQADSLLSRYVSRVPGNVAALKLLGAVQIELGQAEKAIATLSPAEGSAPDDPQVLSLLGTAYLRAKQFDKGNQYLERASKLAPRAAPIRTQLAVGRLIKGESDEAIADLEAAVEADPEFSRADFLLVLTHLRDRDFDKALASARKLAEKRPESPQAQNLVAAALEASGDVEGARAAYGKSLELDSEFLPGRLNLARLALRDGNAAEARKGFEEVLQRSADNAAALVALAKIESDAGNSDKALELLERARAKNANALQPRLVLAAYYLRKGDGAKALAAAAEADRIAPDHPGVDLLLGRAQLFSGDANEAVGTLSPLVEKYPDSAEARFQLALAKAQVGDVEGARQGLEKVIEARPDNAVAKATLARLELRAGNPGRTAELARALQGEQPEASLGWVLAGDAAVADGDLKAAEKAYHEAQRKQASTAVALRLHGLLRRDGRGAEADRLLSEWLDRHPEDSAARLVIASSRQQRGDKDAAAADYERVLESQPDNAVALNNLAWLYFERGDARALDFARRAYERFPERPEIIDTYGWLLVQGGQVEKGLDLLEKAARKATTSGDIRYHHAAALARAGDRSRARDELQRVLDEIEQFGERKAAQALLDELR